MFVCFVFNLSFCAAQKISEVNSITQQLFCQAHRHGTSYLSSETSFWEGEICLQYNKPLGACILNLEGHTVLSKDQVFSWQTGYVTLLSYNETRQGSLAYVPDEGNEAIEPGGQHPVKHLGQDGFFLSINKQQTYDQGYSKVGAQALPSWWSLLWRLWSTHILPSITGLAVLTLCTWSCFLWRTRNLLRQSPDAK